MSAIESIDQATADGSEVAPRRPPYKQRRFGYLGLWHLGRWQLCENSSLAAYLATHLRAGLY
jgi:hypothetical protein